MKTIQVNDEMYKFLMNLSKELNTQNHRCTAMPYFFQVQSKEQIPALEGSGIEAWHCDGSVIETKQEIEDAVNEYKEWDEHTTKFNFLYDYEIEEMLEDAGYNKIYYEYEHVYTNAFLTEKACKEHIKANKHHYNEGVDFLSHAFRNPELEKVMEFLCSLDGGKIHK